ncbi:MAG: tRNA uridine-5-carboxymethylaminomethyl(34) synthesis GTPase MnmE [Pseudomonadota bacterium]
MYRAADTIAAIATPPGRGGVGVIRVSGPAALAIARALSGRKRIEPRRAYFATFRDEAGQILDSGILLYFQGPRSFTGEDVIEVQGHGGPVVMELLLARILALGARAARAGEFSERAFLNGKLDLAQAEAVADLIDAQSAVQARAASRSLEGQFSRAVERLHGALLELRAYVEAAIDFPDEELDLLGAGQVAERLRGLAEQIQALQAAAGQGALLREGARVVLAGRPNAGKSSLLNALAGLEAAIVTDIPGTTRDLLREHIQIDGLPLHIIDTAGIRADADRVEQLGIERAWRAAREADLCLLVVDAGQGFGPEDAAIRDALAQPDGAAPPVLMLFNKIDLLAAPPAPPADALAVSARTGAGLDALRARIKALLGYGGESDGLFSARVRHQDALRRCQAALHSATVNLDARSGLELVAEDLREGGEALGEITGQVSADELLGEIFSRFCIGK